MTTKRTGFFAYADASKARHRPRTSKVHAVDERGRPLCGSDPIGDFHEAGGPDRCARCFPAATEPEEAGDE